MLLDIFYVVIRKHYDLIYDAVKLDLSYFIFYLVKL